MVKPQACTTTTAEDTLWTVEASKAIGRPQEFTLVEASVAWKTEISTGRCRSSTNEFETAPWTTEIKSALHAPLAEYNTDAFMS